MDKEKSLKEPDIILEKIDVFSFDKLLKRNTYNYPFEDYFQNATIWLKQNGHLKHLS